MKICRWWQFHLYGRWGDVEKHPTTPVWSVQYRTCERCGRSQVRFVSVWGN